MTGYTPEPEREEHDWQRIVCTCGTTVALVSGSILRYRCIDRRCRLPGKAKLVYLDISQNPPRVIAETHEPIKVEIRSKQNGR